MPKRNNNARRRPVKQRPARRRQPVSKARKGRGCDPFLHCVYGPLSAHSSGSGAPDGSVEPSVVIDHRSTITIKPDANGDILVAIVPSPYGSVALGAGSAVCTINQADVSIPGQDAYMAPAASLVTGTTGGYNRWPLIPFKENLHSGGTLRIASALGLQATKYRVLTTQAQAEFTGSSMYNSGAAATCKIAHHFSETVPFTADALAPSPNEMFTVGARMTQLPPASFDAVASIAGSRVFPARQSAMIINAPQNFDFQEIRNTWAPFYTYSTNVKQTVFAGAIIPTAGTPGPTIGADPIPGLGSSTVTYYAASGLDQSATVTFETRTCVEYTLAFESPATRFAALPAPPRPAAMLAVKEIGRALPSSFPVTPAVDNDGWLANAAGWYGRTMASIVGSVYTAGGRMLSQMGPMGGVLGGGAQAMGTGMQHLAITG